MGTRAQRWSISCQHCAVGHGGTTFGKKKEISPKLEHACSLAARRTRWQPQLEHTARKDEAASGQKAWDLLCGDQPRSFQPRLPTMLPQAPVPKRARAGGGLPKIHTSHRMLSVCLQCLCDLGKHGLWHCSISPCPFLTLAKVPLSDETCNPSIAPLTIVGQDGGSTQPRPDPEDRDDPKHLRMGTPGHKAAQGQRSVIPAAPPLPLSLGKEMPFKYYFISGSSGKLNPLGIVGVHRVQA